MGRMETLLGLDREPDSRLPLLQQLHAVLEIALGALVGGATTSELERQ